MITPRERALWTALKRALQMIVSAIDSYLGKDETPATPAH